MQSSNFVKEKRLGSGAFGVVYRVRSKRSSKLYVIKEQELNSSTDKKIVMNEIEVLKQLPRHQNVIAYVGSWAENGKGCILMEYASRGSLDDVLKERTSPMSEENAVFLFSQIVLGVNHIHRHSVIHRDLKPANVMMHRVSDGCGQYMDIIKIGDFGISKDTRGSVAKTAVGTKIYMAPEMFHGSSYGYKCDMWSCGIILYELLTNKFPFSARTIEEMMRKIQRGHATPITSGNISRSLVTLTSKLMSVDPDERPRSTHLVRHPAIDRWNEKIRNYLHTNSNRSTALRSHSIARDFEEILRLASSRR